jgi:hypothetical protein
MVPFKRDNSRATTSMLHRIANEEWKSRLRPKTAILGLGNWDGHDSIAPAFM